MYLKNEDLKQNIMFQVPTLRNLLLVVRQDLGFSYKKCTTERSALIEKPNIAAKREQYLKIIMENSGKPEPIYETDNILDHGHTVVRLPPYHCHLNPIELIRGIAKNKIASVNVVRLLNKHFQTLLPKTGKIHASM